MTWSLLKVAVQPASHSWPSEVKLVVSPGTILVVVAGGGNGNCRCLSLLECIVLPFGRWMVSGGAGSSLALLWTLGLCKCLVQPESKILLINFKFCCGRLCVRVMGCFTLGAGLQSAPFGCQSWSLGTFQVLPPMRFVKVAAA